MHILVTHGSTMGGPCHPRWPRPRRCQGFPASAMAKTHAGDWRDPERIRGWAAEVAMEPMSLDLAGRLHA
jgi:hypothetical protein